MARRRWIPAVAGMTIVALPVQASLNLGRNENLTP